MKKLTALWLALFQVLWFVPVPVAQAAVTVPTGPTILVASPMVAAASSAPIPLFKFSLTQDAGETLSSVTVTVTKNGVNNLASSHLASLAVYKDNGDGSFSTVSDLLAGSQATVNINSPTTIATGSNNAIGGGATFFVALSTGASWSDLTPADSLTVQLAADAIATSANSPTVTAVTTAAITADTTGPALTSVVAQNTGGTAAKEAGDSLAFTFNEATNKPVLSVANIPTTLALNHNHSFLDGLGVLTSASWNSAGTVYTLTLSANTSLPTVEPGDTVTIGGSLVQDATGNAATGNAVISGSFTTDVTGPHLTSVVAQNTGGTSAKEAGDSLVLTFGEATNQPSLTDSNVNATLTLNNSHSWLDGAGHIGSATWNTGGTMLTITLAAGTSVPTVAVGDTVTVSGSVVQDASGNPASGSQVIGGTFGTSTSGGGTEGGKGCPNNLINGRLYQVNGSGTVYLAAACRLKVFKGKAVGKAKGKKFKNILSVPSLAGLQVKVKPTSTEDHGKAEQGNENENNEKPGQSGSAHGNAAGANSQGKAKGHSKD